MLESYVIVTSKHLHITNKLGLTKDGSSVVAQNNYKKYHCDLLHQLKERLATLATGISDHYDGIELDDGTKMTHVSWPWMIEHTPWDDRLLKYFAAALVKTIEAEGIDLDDIMNGENEIKKA